MDRKHSPSVFELLACDGLKHGLREAIRYLLNHLYQVDTFRPLAKPKTDEAILIIDLLIEYNYLRTYRASFAENLYNLIRINKTDNSKLKQIYPSLICLTLLPYLKRKLDKYIENLNYKQTRTADELKRIQFYRILTTTGSFVNLLCLVRLAAGKSSYHNILDGMLNIKLMGRSIELDEIKYHKLSLTDKISKSIADLMGRSLTIGSYIIQFLDYWNTHSNSQPLFNVSLPIPEPPEKDSNEKSSNVCLICMHVRQNECALSNTGYVFCYSCIHRYISTKQRCPVTGYPTNLDNIIKLFVN